MHAETRGADGQRGEHKGKNGASHGGTHPVPGLQHAEPPVQACGQQDIHRDFGEQQRGRPDHEEGRERDAKSEQNDGQRNRTLVGARNGFERIVCYRFKGAAAAARIEIGAGAAAVEG